MTRNWDCHSEYRNCSWKCIPGTFQVDIFPYRQYFWTELWWHRILRKLLVQQRLTDFSVMEGGSNTLEGIEQSRLRALTEEGMYSWKLHTMLEVSNRLLSMLEAEEREMKNDRLLWVALVCHQSLTRRYRVGVSSECVNASLKNSRWARDPQTPFVERYYFCHSAIRALMAEWQV